MMKNYKIWRLSSLTPVQILSSIIYIKASSPVMNNAIQFQFIYTKLISTLLDFAGTSNSIPRELGGQA